VTPAEAAGLLGLPENATETQIHEAYAARVATIPPSDVTAVDALARARDALLAGVRWQPPQSAGPQSWGSPQAATPIGLGPQPGVGMPSAAPQAGSVPPAPIAQQPGQPIPQQPGPAYPQQAYPQGYAQPYPPQTPYLQQPPYPGYAAAPAAPTPRRKPLSNGAIIGIALGSTAVFLVVLLVAVIALAGNARLGAASTAPQHGSAAAPTSPSDPSSTAPSGADQSYVIDGVTIQPEDGWTFVLTSQRDCPGAEVIVGFSDSVDGDTIDEHTDTVSLKAGVPYTYTVPDTASTHDYAGIDDLQCVPT
jgi:hypothetical protein